MDVAARLDQLQAANLHRRLRLIESSQGPRAVLEGRDVLVLCSSNYLGLADHPRVRQAAADAAERWGASAGASRLACGNMGPHERLERALAEFHDRPAALLFGSGYLANIGTITALAGEGEVVFADELSHPSIVDGCRLSRAHRFAYRHRDLEHLAWGLRKAGDRAKLIATDGIFAMDGDVAPLPELAELAIRHGCRLVVNDAHGVGTIGPGGRGTVAAAGLNGEVDVIVGSLGKALGSYGAYVCTSPEVRELLINSARAFAFSTAPPPPALGAAFAALRLLDSRPGVVTQLRRNAGALREALAGEGLDVGDSRTQIVPVIVGDAARAMELSERVLGVGVYAEPVRPPAVAEGTARLRLTVMANHRVDELQNAAHTIGRAARELGLVHDAEHELRRAA
ncbi:MAG TPA: 8-amino-7-oxononanoate synthase [Solirubrobacterales bacterium]|jgi:glycine C-acetyltransferase/8-amino-7-oxononanoate synthase